MNKVGEIAREATINVHKIESIEKLNEFSQIFLGKNGKLTSLFKDVTKLDPSERAKFGMEINDTKKIITEAIEKQKKKILDNEINKMISSVKIDPSAPFNTNRTYSGRLPQRGTLHPLLLELKKMTDILTGMGYIVEERQVLTDDYNCFESLNIPKGHPARDMWDTFWTEDGYIPSAHTSSQQNQFMKKYKKNLSKGKPIAVVIPGRCFRNEATDATHEMTFFQLEMVYVSDSATISDMIGTMKEFLLKYFERSDIKIHVQPSYFPFVEPGIQFMNECIFCNGTGCPICKYTGWIEIMGGGFIHPKVLENAGIDSEKYSGFAYGPGIERIIMLKNGIEDIRHFRNGDLRFLKQFVS